MYILRARTALGRYLAPPGPIPRVDCRCLHSPDAEVPNMISSASGTRGKAPDSEAQPGAVPPRSNDRSPGTTHRRTYSGNGRRSKHTENVQADHPFSLLSYSENITFRVGGRALAVMRIGVFRLGYSHLSYTNIPVRRRGLRNSAQQGSVIASFPDGPSREPRQTQRRISPANRFTASFLSSLS
jgi:hypothetical protein